MADVSTQITLIAGIVTLQDIGTEVRVFIPDPV
jgi:hypothetical protein